MTPALSNFALNFNVDVNLPSWSLSPCSPAAHPEIEQARVSVRYRRGDSHPRVFEPAAWQDGQVALTPPRDSVHGRLQGLALRSRPDASGLVCTLEVALPEQQPFLMLRLSLENQGEQALSIDRLELLDASHRGAGFPGLEADGKAVFFSNGWQSWNWTGAYGRHDRFRRTRLGYLTEPLRINPGTPHPLLPGRFGSDFFGVLGSRSTRKGLLAGFLSQREHFGSLLADLRQRPILRLWANGDGARLDPGQRMETDWAAVFPVDFDRPDPLGEYYAAVARENAVQLRNAPSGWSSWYHYYGQIGEEQLLSNLQAASRLSSSLPLELVQLDDGFESAVGDWVTYRPGFPQGVAPAAAAIREAGFTPGLWLAPFILDPHSHLAADHPDWLLRDRAYRPVHAGYLFDGIWTKALDLTQPAVLEHVREVIHKAVHTWGYPYLKLDFLYAGALKGHYSNPTSTRASALRRGLEVIREAAGEEAFLLGCGCPLGTGLGLVDGMRIGADVAEDWHPKYHGIGFYFHGEPDHPSVRNAIQNALTRSGMHGRWWMNDADDLLLRPETRLTLPEVQTLATVISLTSGSLVISDDLAALPQDRLRLAERLFPPLNRRPQAPDLFDSPTPTRLRLDLEGPAGEWSLLAAFNWSDAPQDLVVRLEDFKLPEGGQQWAREFWSGENRLTAAGELRFPGAPAHGVVLLAVRPRREGTPQYLGSDLHLSQGLEISSWDPGENSLRIQFTRPGRAEGTVDLALPAPPCKASLAGRHLGWSELGEGRWRFLLAFEKLAELSIEWENHAQGGLLQHPEGALDEGQELL